MEGRLPGGGPGDKAIYAPHLDLYPHCQQPSPFLHMMGMPSGMAMPLNYGMQPAVGMPAPVGMPSHVGMPPTGGMAAPSSGMAPTRGMEPTSEMPPNVGMPPAVGIRAAPGEGVPAGAVGMPAAFQRSTSTPAHSGSAPKTAEAPSLYGWSSFYPPASSSGGIETDSCDAKKPATEDGVQPSSDGEEEESEEDEDKASSEDSEDEGEEEEEGGAGSEEEDDDEEDRGEAAVASPPPVQEDGGDPATVIKQECDPGQVGNGAFLYYRTLIC